MTVLDDRGMIGAELVEWQRVRPREAGGGQLPVRPARHAGAGSGRAGRPGPVGPATAPLNYRGTGIAMSRAAHPQRRTVSTGVTVALAGLAALITVWLCSIGHFSSDRAAAAAAPVAEQLAVVQVQAGETLAQLAARVAPDVPTGQTVERIRDLNQLGSVAVDVGQTLIAPVS